MIRIIASIVFVIFGGMAMVATHQLGFGAIGYIGSLFVVGGLLWEIWIQPARDEAHRQTILDDIENFKEMLDKVKDPTNLQDAKETVHNIGVALETVADAYVELREDAEDEDEEPVQV